jgi:hypothetical protein
MAEDEARQGAAEYAPGRLACQEALHLAQVFSEMLERHLAGHPALRGNAAWKAKAERAAAELGALHREMAAAVARSAPQSTPQPAPPALPPGPRQVHPEDEVRGGHEVAEE